MLFTRSINYQNAINFLNKDTTILLLVICTLFFSLTNGFCGTNQQTRFFGWKELDGWNKSPQNTNSWEWISPEIDAGFAWNELVASWNMRSKEDSGLKIEARAVYPHRSTRFYVMGYWSLNPKQFARESVNGQKDADGDVQTDILVLKESCHRFQIKLTFTSLNAPENNSVAFLGISLWNSQAAPEKDLPNHKAWGQLIDVPQISQVNYPGGEQSWCSPTCVTMMLQYWSKQLNRSELKQDVPNVVKGVYDPQWSGGGTGNWPFNTAYAGSWQGLRAYVSRFSSVDELETWIAHGLPVVISVSYELLNGKPRLRGDGHLVICVGFDKNGDVIINDPGTRYQTRRTFLRKNLISAWAISHNTVYLIYPEKIAPPENKQKHWFDH